MQLTIDVDETTGKVTIDPSGRKQAGEQWDGLGIATKVVKAAPERRYTLALAYPALRPDSGVAQDGFRDFASPEAVENAAWSYLTKSAEIGLWHREGTQNAGTCVESYIWRAGPWVIKGADGTSQTVAPGDWLVGIVWSRKAWDMIKSGRINGISMQGTASRRKPSPETLAALRQEADR